MTSALLPQYVTQTLGWTLIHWLWQAFAVAVVLAIVLKLLAKVSSNKRYLISCAALTILTAAPILTFNHLSNSWTAPAKAINTNLKPATNLNTINMPVVENTPAIQPLSPAPIIETTLLEKLTTAIESHASIIVYCWLIGVLGFTLWHLGGWCQLQKLRRQMVKPIQQSIIEKANKLAEKIGIKKAFTLSESALVQCPVVVGWLKPAILLPATALTGLTPKQLEAIIAHELAHIKRHDYMINIIQTAIEIIGFYNPAIWWVSSKIRTERENCCDDIAVTVTGDKINYAKTLTNMEQLRSGYKLAVAANQNSLFTRIKRLLTKDNDTSREKPLLTAAIAITLLAIITIPAAFAMSSNIDKKPDSISKSKENDYKVTLDNGVTVELVGLCDYDNQESFWKPDGSIIKSDLRVRTKPELKGLANKAIFFKFNTEDFNLNFSCDESKSSSSTHAEIIKGEYLKNYWVVIPEIKKHSKKTNLRIGVASGQWQLVAEYNGIKSPPAPQNIIFTHPIETKNGTAISVRGEWDNTSKRRFVAIDKKGKLHEGNWGGRSSDNHTIAMGEFRNIRPDEIEKYQIQSRPYQWINFKNVSLMPGNTPDIQNNNIEVYSVNKKVSQFPEAQDFSTPESAYASINRVMAKDDHRGWLRVSCGNTAKKLRTPRRRKKRVDPQWAQTVLNAEILEVRIKDDHAVVIAKFAQEFSTKKIKEPIDYRHLIFENNKWLNKGENRYDTIEQARKKFDKLIDYESKTQQAYNQAPDKSEMFKEKAEELFQKLRNADYEKILRNYNKQNKTWYHDGWKKLDIDYMVKTDWPSFAKWVCKTFKDNPIQSVKLEQAFISDKIFYDFKSPAVPYILTLQDGSILQGNLYFHYSAYTGNWQPMLGIDWHLQDNPIQRPNGIIDIKPEDFRISYDSQRGTCRLTVSIKNNTELTYPEVKLRFYQSSIKQNLDETGKKHTGYHSAGPLAPGKKWNECTRSFHLPDGQYDFTVILDYDDNVTETNEQNNSASIKVEIKDGQISIKPSLKIVSAFQEFIKAVIKNDTDKLKEFANKQLIAAKLDDSNIDNLISTLELDAQALRRYKGIENLNIYKIQNVNGRNEILTSEVTDPRGITGRLCIAVFKNDDIVFDGFSFIENNGTRLSLRPQTLTQARVVKVPADFPQLKIILSEDKSKPIDISPEKLKEFLKAVQSNPKAKTITAPKILMNDGGTGTISTKNDNTLESIELNIKNTAKPDRKTIISEFNFEYNTKTDGRYKENKISAMSTLLSENATAIETGIDKEGNKIILILQPKILEAKNSQSGIIESEKTAETADKNKSNFFELEPVIANLNEPGAKRYVKAVLVIEFDPVQDKNDYQTLFNAKQAAMKEWAITYLSGLSIDKVRGGENLKEIKSKMTGAFNEILFADNQKIPAKVLLKEFVIQ